MLDRALLEIVHHEVVRELINPHGLKVFALGAPAYSRTEPGLVPKLLTYRAFPDVINPLISLFAAVVEKKFGFHGDEVYTPHGQ